MNSKQDYLDHSKCNINLHFVELANLKFETKKNFKKSYLKRRRKCNKGKTIKKEINLMFFNLKGK